MVILAFLLYFSDAFGQAGLLDPTFDPGLGANDTIKRIVLQSDGKIIAVGAFTNFNGLLRNRIVRLNSDGSVDQGFNPGLGADGVIQDVDVHDDVIVIVGRFGSYDGHERAGLVRVNPDGSLNNTVFATGGGASVALLPDGKVAMGGIYSYGNYNGVARMLPDGAIDNSFQILVERFSQVFCVAAQPDNKILFGGDFLYVNNEVRFHIARASANGTLDDNFLVQGGSRYDVYTIAVAQDGKIYQGGELISRLNEDGSNDDSFAWSEAEVGYGPGAVFTIAAQPDGKAIVGGYFTAISGISRDFIGRLKNDGAVDQAFGSNLTLINDVVSTIAVQADGRILIGGFFTTVNGISRPYIARLLGDKPVLETHRIHGGEIIASWPAAYTNWVLQGTKNEKFGDWETVTNAPVTLSGINYVTNRIGGTGKFYRLVKP